MLVSNTPHYLKRLLLGASVIDDSVISLQSSVTKLISIHEVQVLQCTIAHYYGRLAMPSKQLAAGQQASHHDMVDEAEMGLTLRRVVLGPWLARMSYSMSPPVMSKPMNCTFLVLLSSTARGLHSMSASHMFKACSLSSRDKSDKTFAPMFEQTGCTCR